MVRGFSAHHRINRSRKTKIKNQPRAALKLTPGAGPQLRGQGQLTLINPPLAAILAHIRESSLSFINTSKKIIKNCVDA